LKISVNTTKAMTTEGKWTATTKILVNDHITEKVNSSNYLGYTITATNNTDFEIKNIKKKQILTKYSREHSNETGFTKCWEILE
jgi:hypothetical protein